MPDGAGAPPNVPQLDATADEKSKRLARKWWWATGIVIVLLTVYVLRTGGESASSKVTLPPDFCRATARYEDLFERQVANGGGNKFTQREIDDQVERVQVIVDTAPRKIRADAETFLTAMVRVQTNPELRNHGAGPKVKSALDNVARFANQGCGVYAREGL